MTLPTHPTPDPPSVILPAAPAAGFADVGSGRTLDADVVIVGTGPGGSAVASVLAAQGARVVLLEEGPATSHFRRNHAHTARYHMQEGGSLVGRGRNYMPIAAGRGVGGGTLVNSGLSFRAPDAVFEQWAAMLDDEGWSADSARPIYDDVEQRIGVAITPTELAGENNTLIARGVAALGLEGGLAPRNTPGCKGCGACYFGCPSNGKASTNVTFLSQATADGAFIQAETRALDVVVERGRAVSVRGRAIHPDTGEPGGEVVVRADHVVLSAGAIGTPRLLWHSGLGRSLGPVGEGLHVHPGSAVLGLADHPVHLWRGATQGAYFTHPDLPGVLPHTFSAPPEACLVAMGAVGSRLEQGLIDLPRLCGLVLLVSDHGTGRVRAHADGRASIDYDFADSDLERCRRGMVECARVLFAGGANVVFAPVHGSGRHTDLDSFTASLAEKPVRDFTLYAAHPMSTCRMGRDPATSVVDGSGRSHVVPGLWIADSSVLPSSLGVNPQLTVMLAGTLIGQRIAAAA